jgi:hypothetical protein
MLERLGQFAVVICPDTLAGAARVGVTPTHGQRCPEPVLPRWGLGFAIELVGDAAADRFGKGNAALAGPTLERPVLGLFKLYLCTHHDVIMMTPLARRKSAREVTVFVPGRACGPLIGRAPDELLCRVQESEGDGGGRAARRLSIRYLMPR